MATDLQMALAMIKATQLKPLPIVQPKSMPGLWALHVYTDISGHIIASPSLGIYIPSQTNEKALIASLAFPRQFLMKQDELGNNVFCKTTSLEALGILTALCIDPFRFVGREALLFSDNNSTVISFKKGYSQEPWTSSIVRKARELAAALGASLFVEWERRRSSYG